MKVHGKPLRPLEAHFPFFLCRKQHLNFNSSRMSTKLFLHAEQRQGAGFVGDFCAVTQYDILTPPIMPCGTDLLSFLQDLPCCGSFSSEKEATSMTSTTASACSYNFSWFSLPFSATRFAMRPISFTCTFMGYKLWVKKEIYCSNSLSCLEYSYDCKHPQQIQAAVCYSELQK